MGPEAKNMDMEGPKTEERIGVERGQWVRAAILGANDGLLSTTALMLGVGAATPSEHDRRRSMFLSGLAGAVAGACSMAVGEFVSVSTQRDIEKQQMIISSKNVNVGDDIGGGRSPVMRVIAESDRVLPDPMKAAAASGVAFMSGSAIPLAMGGVRGGGVIVRIVAIVTASTLGLALCGGGGAMLGGSVKLKKSALRVVLGGWIAMALTFALLKPFSS